MVILIVLYVGFNILERYIRKISDKFWFKLLNLIYIDESKVVMFLKVMRNVVYIDRVLVFFDLEF